MKTNTIETKELGTIEMIGAIENYTTPVVVEKNVLLRLANLLPTVDFWHVKRQFKLQVNDTKSIEEFTSLLREELSFHLSVNQILEVTVEEEPKEHQHELTEIKPVGKIDLNTHY